MSDATRVRHQDNLAAELCLPLALLAIVYAIAAFGWRNWYLLPWMLGCAIAALVLGFVSYVGSPRGATSPKVQWGVGLIVGVGIPLALLLPSTSTNHGRYRAIREYDANMRQVALAILHYEREHGRVPPAVVRDAEGRPLYSWRVLVLPYLDAQDLYDEFHLDEPWDSPHNHQFLDRMPNIFKSPGDPRSRLTHIAAFVGPGTMFEEPTGPSTIARDRLVDVPDGAANTLLLGESANAIPWTAPIDLEIAPDRPLPALGGSLGHDLKDFAAAFADGSVDRIPNDISPTSFRAMIRREDGAATPDHP